MSNVPHGLMAQFIKETRQAQGLSKNELSKRSGVNRTTIVEMERVLSNPRFDFAWALVKGLGKTLADFEVYAEAKQLEHLIGEAI